MKVLYFTISAYRTNHNFKWISTFIQNEFNQILSIYWIKSPFDPVAHYQDITYYLTITDEALKQLMMLTLKYDYVTYDVMDHIDFLHSNLYRQGRFNSTNQLKRSHMSADDVIIHIKNYGLLS